MPSTFLNRKTTMVRGALFLMTAVSLAACSTSMDRFSDYPDVNTASLPDQAQQTRMAEQSPPSQPSQPAHQQAWQNAPVNPQRQRQQAYAAAGEVTVQSGQTLYSIARAHNLTAEELARANSIPPPYIIRSGQVLRIPGNRTAYVTPRVQPAVQPAPQPRIARTAVHVVRPGETLFAVGREYHLNPYRIADYNGLSHNVGLQVGQRLRIPGETVQARAPRPAARQQAMNTQTPPQKQTHTARLVQQQPAQAPKAMQPRPQQQVARNDTARQTPPGMIDGGFRWPVRGRIISTFGQKPNGMRNEGINIAVPMGTSVKAAESGVVAYAGNELKGYGNLVLIRHANGWVTAYAHNSKLFVKRGDTVKRGDIIAKAGKSGSVTSPQLHFEVRKGASAVNPMKYLDTRQASN